MTLEQAIFQALGQYQGVNQIAGARIYEFAAPQGAARPYVVWQELDTLPMADLDGTAATGGKDRSYIQITAWAVSRDQARQLALQLRLGMEAASQFKAVAYGRRDLPFEADTKLYGTQGDFAVWLST